MNERKRLRTAGLVHLLQLALDSGVPLDRAFEAQSRYVQMPRPADLLQVTLLRFIAGVLEAIWLGNRDPGEPRGAAGAFTRLPSIAHPACAFLQFDSFSYQAASYRAAVDLRRGFGLAHVMETWMAPYLVDGVAATIAAADRAGRLGAVLPMVAAQVSGESRMVEYRNTVIGYIVSYGLFGFTLISMLMIYVVPRFARMLDEMLAGEPLPMLTNIVIAIADLVLKKAWVLVLLLLPLLSLVVLYLLLPPLRQLVDTALCHVPWLGRAHRWRHRRDMAIGLASCVAAGYDLHQGARLLADCRVGWWSGRQLAAFADVVQRGTAWDQAWLKGDRDPVCRSLIAGGAYCQAPVPALRAVAEYCALRLDLRRRLWWSALRPAATLTFGVIIGTVIIGMLLPLVRLMDALTYGPYP